MPRRTNRFQQLVYLVKKQTAGQAQVFESKLVQDRLTGEDREVDICVEQSIAGHPIIISVECRDRGRRADVGWVEEMKAKHERLPTKHLVLISKSGFSAEAQRVATLYGIETLALEDLDDVSLGGVFARLSTLRATARTLLPLQLVIRVAQTDVLPAESVRAAPNYTVYNEGGTPVGPLGDLTNSLLQSEYVTQYVRDHATEKTDSFRLSWIYEGSSDGEALCLATVAPPALRRIEQVEIIGKLVYEEATVPIERGKIGGVRAAWGDMQLMGRKGLYLATVDELGEERITITLQEEVEQVPGNAPQMGALRD